MPQHSIALPGKTERDGRYVKKALTVVVVPIPGDVGVVSVPAEFVGVGVVVGLSHGVDDQGLLGADALPAVIQPRRDLHQRGVVHPDEKLVALALVGESSRSSYMPRRIMPAAQNT